MEKMKNAMNDSAALRWTVLVLVGFTLFSNYYFYDAFSTLKQLLVDEFNFTNYEYGLFASFYSVPNTFLAMAVIGGIFLDKWGIRMTGFMFVFFMAFGALLTAYGASTIYQNGFGYGFMQSFLPSYSPELKMMLLGRFFFGLGAETSIVVMAKVLVKWFKGKNLALAFGLKIGFARLGTFAALQASPFLAGEDGSGLNLAIWLAAMLVCIGLLVFVIYMFFDFKLDQQIDTSTGEIAKKDQFRMKDIGDLFTNRAYIYIALLCLTFYAAVFPFMQYAPDLFFHKFGMSKLESGQIASILPFATAIMTPLFGIFIDRKGRSATVMIFGALILVLVHLSLALTNVSPIIPMALLGVAFSLVPSAMWPTMVKLVDENKIGTAYGLMYSIQNLGLWAIPILAGKILDVTNPGNPDTLYYTPTILLFAGLGFVGLLFALLLKYENKKKGFGVELPLNSK